MKHKGKVLLALLGAMIVLLVPVSAVLADPGDGLNTPNNPRKHIVRDSLYDSDNVRSGWVAFACESVEGFQYSVAVKGLTPHTTYDVRAESLATVYVPFPPPALS